MRNPHTGRTLAIGAALLSVAAALILATPARSLIVPHGSTLTASHRSTPAAASGLVTPAARKSGHAASHRSTPAASRGRTGATSPVHPGVKRARRHVLFGGTTNLLAEQGKVGHLGIVRKYFTLGERFGGRGSDSIMRQGSTMLISLDSPKHGPSYASIAAGKHDGEIRAFLTQVEQAAVHYHIPAVYIDFEHEANSRPHQALGTPAQFVAAWRHIHTLAAHAKVNWNTGGRLHWVLVLEHMAYFTRAERPQWSLSMGFAANYFAGSAYVDAVAADGYNSGSCGYARPRGYLEPGTQTVAPGSMFNPVLAFAQQHGNMPVFVAEWASVRYRDSAVRPGFIHSMEQYVLSHPTIKGVSYWDSWGGGVRGHGGAHSGACNMSVNSDPRSLAALGVMNHALQNS
jgi:hypothetical protein